MEGPLTYQRVPRDQYPWWVKITISRTGSRRTAWNYFVLCAVLGGLGIALYMAGIGFFAPLIAAIGGPIGAVMYLLAIKWVDRYGEWPE